MIESSQAQEDSVLDNSLKFLNHQIKLNLELYNSSYDQNNMTVETDSKTRERQVMNPNSNQPKP